VGCFVVSGDGGEGDDALLPAVACRQRGDGQDVQRKCAIFALSPSIVAKGTAIVTCCRIPRRVWVRKTSWALVFGVEDGVAGWSHSSRITPS